MTDNENPTDGMDEDNFRRGPATSHQLGRKNDIYMMVVSWDHCVTSKDRYITIVSTVAEIPVTYLGFE